MKTRLILLTVAVFHVFTSWGQKQKLTLSEAIQLGLAHSTSVQLSVARVQEAEAILHTAELQRLPSASISGSYLRLNHPDIDLKLATNPSNGGSSTEHPAAGAPPAVDQAAYVLGNLSVPLFSGFRIKNGISSARSLYKATELDAQNNRQKVIADIIEAYSNLFKANMTVNLLKEHLRQERQRVKDFSNMEQNGLIARNDLLKSQLQESNVELYLLDAENSQKLANIQMNQLLQLPSETDLFADSAAFNQLPDAHTYGYWETLSLEHRKDLEALGYRQDAAVSAVRSAKGTYFPSLALTGGYIAAHIPNLLTITNALNVGVGVSYSPSSLWQSGSKVAEAKARSEQLAIQEDMLRDAIRLQLAGAYQHYKSALKKVDVYAQAVALAEENYRIVKNKYANALATTTELLEADVAQLQARLNYASGKADATVAYNKLMLHAGMLTAGETGL